jgi:hypothetical protein
MTARRPKPDRHPTSAAEEGPAHRPPDPGRARARGAALGEEPPIDLDERERRQRARRKAPGPANPPTPPPPPRPARAGRACDVEADDSEAVITDIPPTDPAPPPAQQ